MSRLIDLMLSIPEEYVDRFMREYRGHLERETQGRPFGPETHERIYELMRDDWEGIRRPGE